jgi:hypothetical protein
MSAPLGYNTNNKYPKFPPLMSDGRAVTAAFQPESAINNDIINKNNIKSNWEYRQFLTKNAKELMEQNFLGACSENGCTVPVYEIHNSANVIKDNAATPFMYRSDNLNKQPFGYSSSDLKTAYLSREELTAQKDVTP